MQILSTTTANRDLAAGAVIYNATPDASNARLCYALIKIGDGVNDLDGTGGVFTLAVTIGGQTWQGDNTYIFGTEVRAVVQSFAFVVPANDAVTMTLTSPNAGDTSVAVSVVMAADPLVRTEIGLASANLDTQLADIPTVSEFNARTIIAANYATASAVEAVKNVTDKFSGMLEADGASGYQFTTLALDNSPTGNLSSEEIGSIATSVLTGLAGIQPVVLNSFDPVTYDITLTQGDDYLLVDVRVIDIPVTLPSGIDASNCTATFGAIRGAERIDAVVSVYVDGDDVYARLTFLDTATTTKTPGRYNYDVEFQDAGSNITVVSGVLTLNRGIALDISEF